MTNEDQLARSESAAASTSNDEQLALLDVLDSMKRTKRNRILVCLHATAARNFLQQFVGMVKSEGLPYEVLNETTLEVRANNQWQRVYFASAFQHPDHFAGRVAEVVAMPGIDGAVHAWPWRLFAEGQNKEFA